MSAEAEPALRAVIEGVERAGPSLRARPPDRIAARLAEAWARIADPERHLGRLARERLPGQTGLSLEMVAWALQATFDGLPEALAEAARRMAAPPGLRAAPHRLGALVLAGNVFTACVQPLSMALLAQTPVVAKASSRDDGLPRLFAAALAEVDPELAAACAVVTFPGEASGLTDVLLARASVVSAYGSDATLRALRERLGPGATLIPHGHGLGLGFASARALDDDLEGVARRFARDVAAYDQRGCMSPHAILVEGEARAEPFGRALAAALDDLERELPRGALPRDAGPAQIQWRGVAATRGPLFEGRASAVAVELEPAAIRPSPGYRNALVRPVGSVDGVTVAADALGAHLKTLGVAGPLDAVLTRLPPSVACRVCRAGEMQRPDLLSLADGRLPWDGLRRWNQIG